MRISYYKCAKELLESTLDDIAKFETDDNSRFFKSIVCIYKCLVELRAYMRANPFKRMSDEIYFFKKVKPVIIGKWNYLMVMYHDGNKSPFKVVRMAYWMAQLEVYREFFKANKEFSDYMAEKDDALDSVFFVSLPVLYEREDIHFPSESHPAHSFFEPDFSTIYDYRLSLWIAYTDLQVFAQEQLEDLAPKLLN